MQRRQLNDQLAELDARKTQAGLRNELDERTRAARTRYDEQIAALERRARELAREIDKRESRSAETVKPIVAQLDARRQEILDDYRKQSNEADARFRRRIEDAENRAARIAELQAALAARQSERNDLRSRINVEARKNQIYRRFVVRQGIAGRRDQGRAEIHFRNLVRHPCFHCRGDRDGAGAGGSRAAISRTSFRSAAASCAGNARSGSAGGRRIPAPVAAAAEGTEGRL